MRKLINSKLFNINKKLISMNFIVYLPMPFNVWWIDTSSSVYVSDWFR